MPLLYEDKRSDLLSRGRRGKKEKTDGKSRYEKRVNSRVSTSVKSYNDIDTHSLFKYGILTIGVPVQGETGNYVVRIKFGSFLDELSEQIKKQNNTFNLKAVVRTLLASFDKDDVYISCSCPDWKYRGAFWATMSQISSGPPERRPSKITNPKNDLGPGCKHIMLVLSNNQWLVKVASVIYNYVTYMEQHNQKQYADIIYPAIYHKKYEEPVQLALDDSDRLSSDKSLIDTANEIGRKRGQFKSGNPYRFQTRGTSKDQISLSDIDEEN